MAGSTRRGRSRRLAASTLPIALLFTVAGALAWPAPAEASAYRYWTYWQGAAGAWSFASAGPAATIPADGSIEGWRFAVTTQAGRAGDAPSAAASFDGICGATPTREGSKRVALVIDSGTAGIAPQGQTPPALVSTCVVVPSDATGYQVLRAVATVRTDGGLICGVADYPTGECAPVIDEAVVAPVATAATDTAGSPAPDPTTQAAMPAAADGAPGSGTPWLTLAVAVVAAGVALLLWRRRRDA